MRGPHLHVRDYLVSWFGGTYGFNTYQWQTYDRTGRCKTEGGEPNTDTYIEYIVMWTGTSWQTYNTCKAME
jgi:hypothetical protein